MNFTDLFSSKDPIDRIEKIKQLFSSFINDELTYQFLIDLGSFYASSSENFSPTAILVPGCQSKLLLQHKHLDGKIYFSVFSDALISRGLATLLSKIFSGSSPQQIYSTSPSFLIDLGLLKILSPSRSNGLISLFTEIQKITKNYL
jgi:cysteine desulfuration protein SufE